MAESTWQGSRWTQARESQSPSRGPELVTGKTHDALEPWQPRLGWTEQDLKPSGQTDRGRSTPKRRLEEQVDWREVRELGEDRGQVSGLDLRIRF